uniref:A-103 protein n=1 Tax=Saccharomyces cerevisiae TaxID=4932 RepID=E9PA59_YEASX|nr:A-103 protein [Saccharomyces cerevisiae]
MMINTSWSVLVSCPAWTADSGKPLIAFKSPLTSSIPATSNFPLSKYSRTCSEVTDGRASLTFFASFFNFLPNTGQSATALYSTPYFASSEVITTSRTFNSSIM